MFAVSSSEFAGLPDFIEKVRTTATDSESSVFTSNMDELRKWCTEQGMSVHYSKTPVGVFYTLKYDRAKLNVDKYGTLGRFRSVVFDHTGKICSIAPPKMLKIDDTLQNVAVNSAGGYLNAEEYVEGVMFNLFHYEGAWCVATKSCVGEVSYDHMDESTSDKGAVVDEETSLVEGEVLADSGADAGAGAGAAAGTVFQRLPVQEVLRRRICDSLSLLTNGLKSVPTQYCYSFVLQHPKNQIVNMITEPKIFLIAVYELSVVDGTTNAVRLDRDIFSTSFSGAVFHMPSSLTCVADSTDDTTATFTPHTVADYCRMYGSQETMGATLPGVVFRDGDTGVCYKQRNPKYESVKKRKGMEQKLLSQFLYLRKDRNIDEYLKYHPQHNKVFHEFRERLHEYTLRLYVAYIDHYVKKDNKPLKDYPRELKTHMYKIHYTLFLATMKEAGAFVTKHTVINYVNNLAPAQQLACLNLISSPSSSTVGEQRVKRFGNPNSDNTSRDYQRGRGGSTLAERGGFRTSRGNSRAQDTVVLTRTMSSSDAGAGQRGKKYNGQSSGVVRVHNQFSGLNAEESS